METRERNGKRKKGKDEKEQLKRETTQRDGKWRWTLRIERWNGNARNSRRIFQNTQHFITFSNGPFESHKWTTVQNAKKNAIRVVNVPISGWFIPILTRMNIYGEFCEFSRFFMNLRNNCEFEWMFWIYVANPRCAI